MDKEVEYIVSEYKKQIERLSNDLTSQLSNPKFYDEKGSFNKQRKIALLKQLKGDLLRMDVTSRSFLKTIKQAYTINVEDSLRLFEMITGKKFENDWNYVDSKDILRLQDEYINYMQQGQEKYYKGIQNQLSAMELENKKYIAEIVKDQANNQIIGGDLRKQSVANIMQKMTEKGMTSFIYADSMGNMRSINLKSYAEIQIRSSIAYATNQAVVDSNEKLENDLVQFSSHGTCCVICGTYAESNGIGKVYTTNKERTDYPYLYSIPGFSKGYNSLHVRCKHRITAFYEDYVENAQEIKKFSNMPFEDGRSKEQIKKYDKQQELNRLRYAKRNNLERRKAIEESKLQKDKNKIKRFEETSRKYTSKIKDINKELKNM